MKPRKMQLYGEAGGPGRWWHLVSRVVDRNFVFGGVEREMFSNLLRRAETFSGVEVITWTILSNHFHIVLYVPEQAEDGVEEEVFWERLTALYGREGVGLIRQRMDTIRRLNRGPAGEILVHNYRKTFVRRMNDLSEFMKTLLQRFTTWFNQRHQRVGRLWESRFKSLLIEGEWGSVMTVSAYVDLNAVRAGLVTDPKDYRWCGYAEAVAGKRQARTGLMRLYEIHVRQPQSPDPEQDRAPSTGGFADDLAHEASSSLAPSLPMPGVSWGEVSRMYRQLLYGIGSRHGLAADGKPLRRGMDDSAVETVLAKDGNLSLSTLLRHRIRYFTDGVVLGRRNFIDQMFKKKRAFFGEKRRTGARKMRGGNWEGLWCLRDLKTDVTD